MVCCSIEGEVGTFMPCKYQAPNHGCENNHDVMVMHSGIRLRNRLRRMTYARNAWSAAASMRRQQECHHASCSVLDRSRVFDHTISLHLRAAADGAIGAGDRKC